MNAFGPQSLLIESTVPSDLVSLGAWVASDSSWSRGPNAACLRVAQHAGKQFRPRQREPVVQLARCFGTLDWSVSLCENCACIHSIGDFDDASPSRARR